MTRKPRSNVITLICRTWAIGYVKATIPTPSPMDMRGAASLTIQHLTM